MKDSSKLSCSSYTDSFFLEITCVVSYADIDTGNHHSVRVDKNKIFFPQTWDIQCHGSVTGSFVLFFVAALFFLPLDQMIRGISRCVCSSVCLSANISLGFSYTKFTELVFSMHIPWVRHFLMSLVMTTLSLWPCRWGERGWRCISQTHLAFIKFMRLFHVLFHLKSFVVTIVRCESFIVQVNHCGLYWEYTTWEYARIIPKFPLSTYSLFLSYLNWYFGFAKRQWS